jgi:photoactive yellow protein
MDKKDDFIYADTVRFDSFGREEFDALHFGAIKLDQYGVVLKYNAYEGRLAGRDPGEVVGKNFFTEVAPCTNVQEFAGRFREGVEKGALYATFPYRFLFPDKYVDVEITMMTTQDGKGGWIFVKDSTS